MLRIKLFISCILMAFVALINPNVIAKIFSDHRHMKNKRFKKARNKHRRWIKRMGLDGPNLRNKNG